MTSQHVLLVASPRSGAGLLQAILRLDSRWVPTRLSDPRTSIDDTTSVGDIAAEAFSGGEAHTVDWLPRWSTRLGDIGQAAPGLRIVYVVRDPRYAVSSGAVAWRSGRFITEKELPGWWGEAWSFPLVPEWESLIGQPLPQIVATQWLSIAAAIRRDLAEVDPAYVSLVTYEQLVEEPAATMRTLVEQLGLDWEAEIPETLPVSLRAITKPDPKRVIPDIAEVVAGLEAAEELREGFLQWAAGQGLTAYAEPLAFDMRPRLGGTTQSSSNTPFHSDHTRSFVELLESSKSSVVLTTYKSGHVIVARVADGRLDTSFTSMDRPMGVAVGGNRLAIGTTDHVVTYVRHTGLGETIATERQHDAVYVPRVIAFTGDVAIHEMDYDSDGQLWFVNTRFSCLCTLDLDSSFTPRWRPSWITALAGEDRCHLNGMAMVDGRPKYVSALAQTDTVNGWREHKGTSGVIVDVETDEVVVEGLSMPHSPRVYDGSMWVLESGRGMLVRIDMKTWKRTDVAEVPGFSRGLAFLGRYAIIGLSQVRESVFTGLPVTQTAAERNCGAWVVDVQSGVTVGRLRFSGVVTEIFDVRVLWGQSWPLLSRPGELTPGTFTLSPETIAQMSPQG